jgi:hypothetical protein
MKLLPDVYSQLRFAFRGLAAERREGAIAECLAGAAVAYARLHEQGKAERALATPLAQFAARQFRADRRAPQLRRRHVPRITSACDAVSVQCRAITSRHVLRKVLQMLVIIGDDGDNPLPRPGGEKLGRLQCLDTVDADQRAMHRAVAFRVADDHAAFEEHHVIRVPYFMVLAIGKPHDKRLERAPAKPFPNRFRVHTVKCSTVNSR